MPVGARWRAGFLKLITIFMRRAGEFYQIPNTTWSYSIRIVPTVIDDLLYYTLAGLTTICRIIFVALSEVSDFVRYYVLPGFISRKQVPKLKSHSMNILHNFNAKLSLP
jgi:hypothetical protein